MYKVTATITHPMSNGFNRVRGVYIPKGKTTDTKKIKKECDSHIRKNIKFVSSDNDENQLRKDMKISIHVTKIETDFWLQEK